MKIVCIADLQGQCKQIKPNMLPDGDILLVAGDMANNGTIQELEDVNSWFGELKNKYRNIICVAGNHDQDLQDIDGHKLFTNAIYLQDELVEIEGVKIYGTPMAEMNELRMWYDWAFDSPAYLKKAAEDIPDGLDILLTHNPPWSILDQLARNGQSVGSRDLFAKLEFMKKPPRVVVFGHIHECSGTKVRGNTLFVNAAITDEYNTLFNRVGDLFHQPIVFNV